MHCSHAQGGTCSIHDRGGGCDGGSYFEPKKVHEPEILYPGEYLASKFSTKKYTRPSTSILIYSIRQTLRPKKIRDRFLDPKKYRGRKFSSQKSMLDRPVMKTASTPPPPWALMTVGNKLLSCCQPSSDRQVIILWWLTGLVFCFSIM